MLKPILVLSTLAMSCSVMATTAIWTATVTRILIDDENYGQCMAQVTPGPETQPGMICGAEWITFDCSGNYGSKTVANVKVAAAQLALVTGQNIAIHADDMRKHNGYCYSYRIDNIAP